MGGEMFRFHDHTKPDQVKECRESECYIPGNVGQVASVEKSCWNLWSFWCDGFYYSTTCDTRVKKRWLTKLPKGIWKCDQQKTPYKDWGMLCAMMFCKSCYSDPVWMRKDKYAAFWG